MAREVPRIVALSPFRCRMWDFHDRLEGQISEETCREEIESFEKHGQLVPVLGRPLGRDPDHDVELIYGARRLFVARHLDKPLLVELRDIADGEAIVAMDIENRLRRDVSPYERGRSYARFLRTGYFHNQEEMARALKISASQVSRLLKLARLPTVIVDAFGKPTDICEQWAQELTDVLADESRRARTIRRARVLAEEAPRPEAREVFRQLISETKGRARGPRNRDEVVRDETGEPVMRIRRLTKWTSLMIPSELLTTEMMVGVRAAVIAALAPQTDYGRHRPKMTPTGDEIGQGHN
jgi:ParB family transcriptional regulator, chromosome partitioning protein